MPEDVTKTKTETLRTLPGDDVRQIMWRFADRFDVQMLVQSARQVARGPVAKLVAEGARNTHEWTDRKAEMLKEFDASGLTSAYLEPEHGGYIQGPKNMALALMVFEMAWVDAGAATCGLATGLALAPIQERGTEEQKERYMKLAAPGPGKDPWRGAFCLTEPLPYVGVETGLLSGKARIAEWVEGEEPVLQVSKRGRFITSIGFADFVTAAVDSGDERIKGSCIVILEQTDPGVFDRGAPARKLVHQISWTSDPIFSLRVPASRIVGGYTVNDGVIVPNYSHGEIIEAVFRRTRVAVGLMTSAKLLSAVEPLIRYHRDRFRGAEAVPPGSPRHELGLQQREDVLHRLLEVWATGEAGASLGFAAARLFDEIDPLDREKDKTLAAQGIKGGMAAFKVFRRRQKDAIELIRLQAQPVEKRDRQRYEELNNDTLLRFILLDSLTNILCPAAKLWNTGHGANVMREAVSLMGGYGITEDCPGFLGHKWMDAQLEATYEGPEAVQRRQLSLTMTNEVFLAQFRIWIHEMCRIGERRPGAGACTLVSGMLLWLWTLEHLRKTKDAEGVKLFQGARQGVTFPLADALCWLLASRQQILDLLELEEKGPQNPVVAEGLDGLLAFFTDLAHIQAARAAGEVGRICAELVFGYNRQPARDEDGHEGCSREDKLAALAGMVPGMSDSAAEAAKSGGLHPPKARPCARLEGLEDFTRLRTKVDASLTGSQLAKDRAARALTQVMIPAALDYPA